MPDSSNCVFHSADSCGVPVGPRNRVWHISYTGRFTLCTRRVLHFNKDERVNEDVVVAHVVHGSQSVTTVVRGVVMESSVGRGIGHVEVEHVEVVHVEVVHVEDIVVAVADNASNASVAVKRASVHTVGGEVDIIVGGYGLFDSCCVIGLLSTDGIPFRETETVENDNCWRIAGAHSVHHFCSSSLVIIIRLFILTAL